ncbi:hypothetical protein TOTORO_00230 [Serratia phage vB_SmaS-Totoro]|nr:hypothetical protein TOTORO_00230 [Serratia phage vB_SmaS-Totoro]
MGKLVVVDSYGLTGFLLNSIRTYIRQFPEFKDRINPAITLNELQETTARIIWNIIQKERRFGSPEYWDDIEEIRRWFVDYDPEGVFIDDYGEEQATDEMSGEFFREVVDMFEVRVRTVLTSIGLDLSWEYLEYEKSTPTTFLLRSHGDYRIYDYHKRNG